MNIFNVIRLNLKKLTVQRGKALFLIVPLGVLVFITVILVSQLKNFQTAIDNSVFETLKNQATLIQIDKSTSVPNLSDRRQSAGTTGGSSGGNFQQVNFSNNFSQADLATIQKIPNIISASLNTSVPANNIQTSDLFDGITYKINSLNELDSTSAGLYTEENFGYTEGDVIPIILNSNTFLENYEDWGDKTSISIDFQTFRPGQETNTTENPSPIKSKAIEYDKDGLIGKEFTMSFGGLDTINDYTVAPADGKMTFTKLTDAEYNQKLTDRQTAISAYWDYSKISTPVTYKFKVVGLTTSGSASYIPQEFANALMKKLIQNQLDAKKADPATDLLDKTFLGLSYDGTQLSTGSGFGFSRQIVRAVPGGAVSFGGGQTIRNEIQANPTTSYNIPGLVIQNSTDGKNTITGIATDSNLYATSVKTAQNITVKIDSVYNRGTVVKAINDAGFAFQDVSDFSIFTQIQSTIQAVSFGFIIGFIIITILIILLTMMKFVSDSRKEVGIFRAIGMKKFTVLLLFTSQAIIYTLVGSVLGFGVGVLANFAISPVIGSTFNNFIAETIKKSFNVVVQNDSSLFYTIDYRTIGFYLLGLLIISFIVSLIPAFRATTISPVEAIKGE